MNEQQRAIVEELVKRGLVPAVDFSSGLFPQQRAPFVSRADLVACLCTRRAGKSTGGGHILYRAAQKHRGSIVPYIALTRGSARNIMWPILQEIDRKYNLGAEFVESKLTVKVFGSEIILFGADQKNFIERLRGPKYPVAIVDEAQAFRSHLSTLIDDVLTPAVMDYSGTIYMFGTPGPIPYGLFFDATTKDFGWEVFKWSLLNNPHLPDPQAYLQKLIKRNHWTELNPTYRREYLGEWVIDTEALVYKFRQNINEYDALPENKRWSTVIGVDYGWNDKTAFSVLCYEDHGPKVYIKHVEAESNLIPSQIAQRLLQLIETYKPDHIIADTGGLGKSITEEMIRRYSIPMQAAQKTDKLTWISLLNGDFVDGHLFVNRSLENLKDQYLTLVKDSDHGDGREDPGLPNDLCDAVLYAWRFIRAYHFDKIKEKPKTQIERWQEEELRMIEQDELRASEEKRKEWWER